jgi:hypothetical protein
MMFSALEGSFLLRFLGGIDSGDQACTMDWWSGKVSVSALSYVYWAAFEGTIVYMVQRIVL